MEYTDQLLLHSIKQSLWEIDFPFPSDTDWNAVLKEAEAQAVLNLMIGAAPAEVRESRRNVSSSFTAQYVRILYYQNNLYTLLKQNNIPMVILKGAAAAIYYPHPEQRVMGDIDFLVPEECFNKAKDLLSQNDYEIDEDPRYQRHIVIKKDRIVFEMHRYFSSETVNIEQFINAEMSRAEIKTVSGYEIPMLPRLSNGLVLLGHLAQHLRSALGLRQVIDWMMYAARELDDAFWDQDFENAVKETGLETLAVTATRMCQIYLGLSEDITWCQHADSDLCAELMESVLTSGNFGKKQGQGAAIEKVYSSISRKGLFRHLQATGEHNWEAYRKHKWLKPFCWLYQIGRYIKQGFRTKRSSKQVKEDLDRGKRRSIMLRKLGIDSAVSTRNS